jgi:hypothetical protein
VGLYNNTSPISITIGVTNITPTAIESPEKIDASRPWLDLSSFLVGSVPIHAVEMPIDLYWWDPPATTYSPNVLGDQPWSSSVLLSYNTNNGVPASVALQRPEQFPFGSEKWCHVWYGFARPGGGVASQPLVGTLGGTLNNFEAMMEVSEDSTQATFTGTICGRVNIAGLSNPRPYVPGGYTTRAGGLQFVATVPFSWDGFSTTITGHACASFLDSGYGWTADIEVVGVTP